MAATDIRYAEADTGAAIAYQVFGEGPDLVLVTEFTTPLVARWDMPPLAAALERLGSFVRVISFDKRGVGCSDPLPAELGSAAETWTADIRTVMDAVGSERAAIVGGHTGGSPAMLFAASYPERTSHLILINTTARARRAVAYPWGIPDQTLAETFEPIDRGGFWSSDRWEGYAWMMFRDPAVVPWFRRHGPLQASPTVIASILRMEVDIDVRGILPSIQAPTLVLHRADNDFWRVDNGRFLGRTIAGARYVELPGRANVWWAEDSNLVVDEIEEFLTGARGAESNDRVLATVLFTDVVASTEHAIRLGDKKWSVVMNQHDELICRSLEQHHGRKVNPTGDGVLATFDGPARAVRCAQAIIDTVKPLGIEVRAGLHTGEIELRGADIGGIAVHSVSGCPHSPVREKSSFLEPSPTSSPDRDFGLRTEASTNSRACLEPGDSSLSRADRADWVCRYRAGAKCHRSVRRRWDTRAPASLISVLRSTLSG